MAYFSRKLTPAERAYSTTDRELLAVLLTARRFRPYLHGQYSIVNTDHEPLVALKPDP